MKFDATPPRIKGVIGAIAAVASAGGTRPLTPANRVSLIAARARPSAPTKWKSPTRKTRCACSGSATAALR